MIISLTYSSAPELVSLLSELNDASEQLESKVNPLLSKVFSVLSIILFKEVVFVGPNVDELNGMCLEVG